METFSFIRFTFNSDLLASASDTISFEYGILPTVFATVTEEWVVARYASQKVTEGTPTANPGERSAINFAAAFEADYNVSKSLFVVERVVNVIDIKCTDIEINFQNMSVPAAVGGIIGNQSPVPFGIKTITFAEASPNPCVDIVVSVETWQQVDSYNIDGGAPIGVGVNPFTFEHPRTNTFVLEVTLGVQNDSRTINTPRRLFSSGIDVDIDFVPSGSTVTVNTIYATGGDVDLIFEYSLDDVVYQPENVFTDMLPDTYTMYVKDQFGCMVSAAFAVSVTGINSPFAEMSKSNSIRHKYNINWGDASNYKNDENTLSCEEDVEIPYTEIQQFQTADKITTQFRSNYLSNNANVREKLPSGAYVVTGQSVIQLTNNIGLKDRRDARIYSVINGIGFDLFPTAAVYFTSGNIYDYDTGVDIGDYTLNGGLPEWAVIGNYIMVGDGAGGGTWSRIVDVVYDESKQAEVILTNVPYTGPEIVRNVRSLYNRQNYEVYEFIVDMSLFQDKSIQTQVLLTDGTFPNVEFLSERIDVAVRWPRTRDITYYNRVNTDLIFALGLRCRVRMQVEKEYGKPIEETQTYKTDSTAVLISAEIHEAKVYEFSPMTTPMMWLLIRALSHSNITIDGVEYVRDTIEVSEGLEDSNLYDVKATMIKARNVYASDSGNLELNVGVIEIPALIETGTGFIMYQ